jgi:hypothetical protein
VFETERAIALASAKLTDVITLWPGRDAYATHSADAATGRPFTLFEPLEPVPHALYLAHDTLLALTGKSTVEVRLELATRGAAPLDLAWEYWDGVIWRAFKTFRSAAIAGASDSLDGSLGLTRSGIVRLVSDCSESKATKIAGIEARWIRARASGPVLYAPGVDIAEVDRVGLRTIIDRTLPASCAALADTDGILAEHAYAGETKLDLTKSVQPLGGRPQIGSAFYLADEEIFAKTGAEVTLCFKKVLTPEEKADQEGADLELDVAVAQKLVVDGACDEADAVLRLSSAMRKLVPKSDLPAGYDLKEKAVLDARADVKTQGINSIKDLAKAVEELRKAVAPLTAALESAPGTIFDVLTPFLAFASKSDLESGIADLIAHNKPRLKDGGDFVKGGIVELRSSLSHFQELTPFSAGMAAGAKLPTMDAPQIAWEYWNGAAWAPLTVTASTTVRTFRATGSVNFVVPRDIESTTVNAIDARWIRARLVAGGYGLVHIVSWRDADTGKLNFHPMVEYRPPTLEVVRLGYLWRSSEEVPEHALAHNDFAYADVTENAAARGDAFTPIAPVSDRTSALYLGFDAPLPADLVSLYLDIEEVLGETDGPPVVWEHWNGVEWLSVRAQDDTHGLALPGMVGVVYPGVAADTPMLARFGTPRTWLRARLETDRTPRSSVVDRVSVNAAWAAQLQTFENEVLGGSNGQPDQVFFARSIPVLEGEMLEVRELSGARAAVEESVLRAELARAGVPMRDVRSVRDARTGKTTEVWVRWRATPNLLFARPGERAYAVERTRGRILFGGRTHAMIPPAGTDNIRLSSYRSGGGVAGNVARGHGEPIARRRTRAERLQRARRRRRRGW